MKSDSDLFFDLVFVQNNGERFFEVSLTHCRFNHTGLHFPPSHTCLHVNFLGLK